MDFRRLSKQFQELPNFVDEENRIIEGTIHYETIDREGDYIALSGVTWDDFMINPHVTTDHRINTAENAVAKVLSLRIEGKKLIARMEFDGDDPNAMNIFNKLAKGYLSAFSPDWTIRLADEERREIDGQLVNYVSKANLISVSVVAIPMNQKATTKTKSLTKNKDVVRLKKSSVETARVVEKGISMDKAQMTDLADMIGNRVSKSIAEAQEELKQKQADDEALNARIDERIKLAQKGDPGVDGEPNDNPAPEPSQDDEPDENQELNEQEAEEAYQKAFHQATAKLLVKSITGGENE